MTACARRLGVVVVTVAVGSGLAGCWSVLDLLPSSTPAPPPAESAKAPAPPTPLPDAAASAATDSGSPHRVFVTSTVHPGSSLALSASGACSAAASAAGLSGRFVAWLSFSSAGAKERLMEYGPWVTTRGQPVAHDRTDLTKGTIRNPIAHDEHGLPFPEGRSTNLVWTGTDASGRTSAACADWSKGDETLSGTVGNATQSDGPWTADPTVTGSCLSNYHVYCFEQP